MIWAKAVQIVQFCIYETIRDINHHPCYKSTVFSIFQLIHDNLIWVNGPVGLPYFSSFLNSTFDLWLMCYSRIDYSWCFFDFIYIISQTKELLGCQSRSMALYSKAIILLTFILQEATALPLNPLFSLSPFNQQRIHRYIANLRSHLCSAQLTGQQQRSIKN